MKIKLLLFILCMVSIVHNVDSQEYLLSPLEKENVLYWLVKYDYDDSFRFYEFLDMYQTPEEEYILSAFGGNNKAFIVIMDKNGLIRDTIKFSLSWYTKIYKIVKKKNTYIFFGETGKTYGRNNKGLILLTDEKFKIKQQFEIKNCNRIIDAVLTGDDYIVLGENHLEKDSTSTNVYAARINKAGGVVWEVDVVNEKNEVALGLFKDRNDVCVVSALSHPSSFTGGRKINSDTIILSFYNKNGSLLSDIKITNVSSIRSPEPRVLAQ
jgi:hypothetical protein